MPLSDEDKKRIEEEEYRKHVQAKIQDTQRVDVNVKSDQRIETHGVGREMYRDAKTMLDLIPVYLAISFAICFLLAGRLYLLGGIFY